VSDLLPPWVLALLVVALAVLLYGRRVLQPCPHCGRLVRRAHRGWLRCPHCHRQYHRSVRSQR